MTVPIAPDRKERLCHALHRARHRGRGLPGPSDELEPARERGLRGRARGVRGRALREHVDDALHSHGPQRRGVEAPVVAVGRRDLIRRAFPTARHLREYLENFTWSS